MPDTLNHQDYLPIRDHSGYQRARRAVREVIALGLTNLTTEQNDFVAAIGDASSLYESYCPAPGERPTPSNLISYLKDLLNVSSDKLEAETGIRLDDDFTFRGSALTAQEICILSAYFQIEEEALSL